MTLKIECSGIIVTTWIRTNVKLRHVQWYDNGNTCKCLCCQEPCANENANFCTLINKEANRRFGDLTIKFRINQTFKNQVEEKTLTPWVTPIFITTVMSIMKMTTMISTGMIPFLTSSYHPQPSEIPTPTFLNPRLTLSLSISAPVNRSTPPSAAEMGTSGQPCHEF